MRFKLFALVAILAICAFSINANAQQADGITWNIGLYANTGYYSYDKDFATYANKNDKKADLEMDQFDLNPGSGFAAVAKKGNLYGDMSYNLATNTCSRWNVTWKPGNGFELLVGKAFTPYNNTNNMNLIYNWSLMAQYSTFDGFPFEVKASYMGVYVALLQCPVLVPTNLVTATYETDQLTPKVAVGYVYGGAPTEPFMFAANFQVKQYKIEDAAGLATSTLDGETVLAYKFNVDFAARKLAGMVDILASAYYGINFQQLGFGQTAAGASQKATESKAYYVAATDSIENTVTMGGHAGVAVNIPGTVHKVAAGVGYESSKPDYTNAKKDEEMQIFAAFHFGLENNFYIVPTIILRDKKKDAAGLKQGKESWYGIGWVGKV